MSPSAKTSGEITGGVFSLGPLRLIADDLALALDDQFFWVTLVKHTVAGFERNPSTAFRGVRLTALGDADFVVHDKHVAPVASVISFLHMSRFECRTLN